MIAQSIEEQYRMISVRKTTSIPSPTNNNNPLATNPTKHKKQYLLDLQTEVNKSRIAIQNMSHTKAVQPGLYKKVEELQKQLHRSMLTINQQANKNKTLCGLVNHLKGQMNEFQVVQKNSEQYESNNFEKKIKKVEYDIKQILHKYNEEVAKINSLKEDANAARDQRVVYSNLFNKIEKQIKHYEQHYKQTLIKNEIFLQKKKGDHNKKESEGGKQMFQQTNQNFDHVISTKSISRQKIGTNLEISKLRQTKSRQAKKSIKRTDTDMFLTNIKDSKVFIERASSEISSNREKNADLNRNIQNMIEEKEGEIRRLIITAECKSFQEVFQYYNQIHSANRQLRHQVQRLDEQIDSIEIQMHQIAKQKRTSDVYENGQITQFANLSKNTRLNKNACHQYELTEENDFKKIVGDLCAELNIDCEGEDILNDDILRQIDEKVESFITPQVQRRKNRRQSKMVNAEQMSTHTDRGADEILQKIERFNECEKIFDRNMLEVQYQKQISKIRKKGKRSN